jgi:hypothetical protein
MPLWTRDIPPAWPAKNGDFTPVATEGGWVDPVTGEVLVAISSLATKAGPGDVLSVAFGAASYIQGAPLTVSVTFNERVDVTAGASIVVSSTGTDVTLYALAQTGVSTVLFNREVDLTTPTTVPAEFEDATLSIAAQTITGTVEDSADEVATTLSVSAPIATAAGTRLVPGPANITEVAFDESAYVQEDPLSVTVTFTENVDVTAGAAIVVSYDGVSGDVTLYAAAQSDTDIVVFNLQVDLLTPAEVPNDPLGGTLSVDAQTLTGTIVDSSDNMPSHLVLGAPAAATAGSIVVPEV